MTEDTPEDTKDSDDDSNLYTDDTDARFVGLNSVLSGVLVLSLPAIMAYALYTGTALAIISQPWFLLYSTLILMAATWAFGKETLEAVQKARGK